MNLKEELENIETEEIEMGEEDRIRKIEESICWIHRRIRVIVEHIDKEEEKATPEEEELWDCGYSEGYEDGVNSVKSGNKEEIEAIEKVLGIPIPSQNLTSLSHAIQSLAKETTEGQDATKERTSSEYAKGYKDGVDALAEMLMDEKTDQAMANKKELIEAMEKALSIKIPKFPDLASVMSQTQAGGKKETPEGTDETEEPKTAKNRVLGLGRKIGDV